jgi:hypothetical protein
MSAVTAFGVFTCTTDIFSIDGLAIAPLLLTTPPIRVTGVASGCAQYDGSGNLLSIAAPCAAGPIVHAHSIDIEAPVVDDSGKFGKKFWSAVSLQNASCDTDTGTVTLNLEIRGDPNTSGTEALSAPITCSSSGSGAAVIVVSAIPSGGYVSPTISGISGTPSLVRVNFQTN